MDKRSRPTRAPQREYFQRTIGIKESLESIGWLRELDKLHASFRNSIPGRRGTSVGQDEIVH
jgi:hypothetical protein